MTARASARANTVSVAYLHAVIDHAQLRGIAPAALIGGLPIDPAQRDSRVPEAVGAALFDRAAALLGDGCVGLHVGEQVRPGHYGVLGYVAMNCANLGEALAALRRYQALVIDLGGVEMQQDTQTLTLAWHPDTERPYRQLAEFNIAGLISFVRWLAGRQASARRIEFAYPAPADLAEHRRIFDCELVFDAPCYRLVVPRSWLGAPLIQPDPAMHALMLRRADALLHRLPRGPDLLDRARAAVARALEHPPVELEAIAAGLALSPRSLQRRLQDAGLGFSQLVEAVRRELAERYLADPTLDLADIAFLLGYSEASAFQRAFKRWTGMTPAQRRAQNDMPGAD